MSSIAVPRERRESAGRQATAAHMRTSGRVHNAGYALPVEPCLIPDTVDHVLVVMRFLSYDETCSRSIWVRDRGGVRACG